MHTPQHSSDPGQAMPHFYERYHGTTHTGTLFALWPSHTHTHPKHQWQVEICNSFFSLKIQTLDLCATIHMAFLFLRLSTLVSDLPFVTGLTGSASSDRPVAGAHGRHQSIGVFNHMWLESTSCAWTMVLHESEQGVETCILLVHDRQIHQSLTVGGGTLGQAV